MAKNGGGGWVVVVVLAALGIAYLSTGRGDQNSPLIPDSIEGKIDLVVKARAGILFVNAERVFRRAGLGFRLLHD
jgi:hypothetical protein